MPPEPVNRRWLWAAVVLTAIKLWLTRAQTIYAIGPAFHDDQLFVSLAAHLLRGEWLGPYDQFTLAKGPLFPLFMAIVFWLGVPLMLAQQALYAGASAVVTRALFPWLRTGAARFAVYALLVANPMSYDAGNLSRVMRQNIYTPLGLLVIAGLVQLFARRRESWRRQAGPAVLAGLALGGFWLTREESVWLLPAMGLLLGGLAWSLRRELAAHGRALAVSLALVAGGALVPILTVCALNLHYYSWFGTVEFREAGFNAAYGALTRPQVGPHLPQVPVTREMREAAYGLSPSFARLRPQLEGPVGDHWADKTAFSAADRQIRGGWFMWALRDAVVEAGIATDAGTVARYWRQVADELNAACDAGRIAALPRRSGFLPPLDAGLARPLADGLVEYGTFFFGFKGFTAASPDSIGDYAELKPFRTMTGNKLSYAPRSPLPEKPNQDALDERKLAWLEALGTALGQALAIAGPLVLLAGLLRLLESLLDRRISFALGLAGALLTACLAYLAINVLVHVTSFYNMSPAAMAAAYPLYLLALAAIVIDVHAAWVRPAPAGAGVRPAAARWLWLMPAGTALIVFAARLREIHVYASDVPYLDQWFIEAKQIIAPWLDHTLGVTDFFRPHFEHLPVWTRLLAWLEVVVTGRWDPLVQMTVNAGLHTLFIWLVARWVWRTFAFRPAAFVTALLLLGGALPFAWENIAWGFQSQFPLALLCLFVHVHGACTHAPRSRGWWLAQAAGVAGLLTLASMWVAPLAVAASLWWTGSRDRRALIAPVAIAATGLLILAVIHAGLAAEPAFAQVTWSPINFLHGALHLLGWPSNVAGALALLQLPWLLHALGLRRAAAAAPVDRMIFALGLWNAVQAAALAFARFGDTGDFVSRYGDLLFVGVLAGTLALVRLAPAAPRGRPLFLAAAVMWTGLVVSGLFERSTEGHTRYFHQTAAHDAELRRSAVQAYLRNGDRHLLEQPETKWILTESTGVVTELLDRPDFRALLPAPVNPASAPDAAGNFVRWLQARWLALLLGGALLAGTGGIIALWARSSAVALPPVAIAPGFGWARLCLGIGVVAAGGLFTWSDPLSFDADYRWAQVLGGDQAVKGLSFAFATPVPFGPERLQGAAPIAPIVLRNRFYGTAPAGPELTCTALSSAFTVTKPWLIVPYAGYPVGDGNGLRLRRVDAQGNQVGEEIGCPGPNLDGIGYWAVDVRAWQGQSVRLVLYDGRTDTLAWVAAAPPIPADSRDLADKLTARLRDEQHIMVHSALSVIALVAGLGALVAWWQRRA